MYELKVAATLKNMDAVMEFVEGQLEAHHCSMKAQTQIDVAVDELFTNIASYAYRDKPEGAGQAVIQMDFSGGFVEITFIDWGTPYNPLEKPDPDVTLSVEDRPIGGLGIYIVKKTMDNVSYRYDDGRNLLTIRKQL